MSFGQIASIRHGGCELKVVKTPVRPVYPSPAGLITSVDNAGRPNIITLGEVYNLSILAPVVVGVSIAPERYSHGLIKTSGEFVVNFPTTSILEKVDRCGTVSGRTTDKFSVIGLTPLPARKVSPPLIAECPLNLECLVEEVRQIGDHDMFIGRVLVQHVDSSCLDQDGRILVDKLDMVCYAFGEYWSLGRRLGAHGFTAGRM
jgi:flavin reductase (DIM6/NTAB) family NADH-FMN oxidoreductase RutF